MSYKNYITDLLKTKEYMKLNWFVINNCKEIIDGKVKITKAAAKHLEDRTIVDLGCKCKEVLSMIPEYPSTDFRALLVDWLLDCKLDREYKKPSMKQFQNIWSHCISGDCAMQCILLMEQVGITKDEYIKSYNKLHPSSWLGMFRMLSGSPLRPTDTELRKMNKRYKDIMITQLVSKFTDEEAKTILNHPGNNSDLDQKRYIKKHIKKFNNNVMLYGLLKFQEDFNRRYAIDPMCYEMVDRLRNAGQPALATIIKGLYPNTDWYEGSIKLADKDEDLETALALLPDDQKIKMIYKYLGITEEDVQNWNFK